MAKKRKSDDLTAKMDAMALALLADSKAEDTSMANRLDIFEKVSKWIMVKYKIDGDDSGSALADYKQRIRSPQGSTPDKPAADNRKPAIRSADAERGGAALEAIKRRIPAANAVHPIRDSGSAGGAFPAVAGAGGGILARPASGDGPDPDTVDG